MENLVKDIPRERRQCVVCGGSAEAIGVAWRGGKPEGKESRPWEGTIACLWLEKDNGPDHLNHGSLRIMGRRLRVMGEAGYVAHWYSACMKS